MQPILAEPLDEYKKRLRSTGLKELGRGRYGSVFSHPTEKDVVVKIVSPEDDAYMEFVHLCVIDKHNRWLPRILDVEHTDLDEGGFKLVFLQRLKPARDQDVIRAFQLLAPWTEPNTYSDRTRLSYPEWGCAIRMATDGETRRLAIFLCSHFNRLDLFTNNFMMRDQQVVFNDPLTPVV